MKIKGKSKDPKRAEADKKRIESMIQMKKEYKYQKNLIKEALSNVDIVSSKKVVFNDNDYYDSINKQDTNDNINGTLEKKALFDNDDDEVEEEKSYNFEVKQLFEDEKGQKLLQLQSRYKKDNRFKLDDRFLDDDTDEGAVKTNNSDTTENEHQMQLQILENVLGKPVIKSKDSNQKDSKKERTMLRFDPTEPEHSKFEIKENLVEKKKKKKKDETKESIIQEDKGPNVSKDTFYKVSDGLKDIFQEKQEFSLLEIFNQRVDETVVPENDDANMEEKIAKKTFNGINPNPFRYDSSSDDEDETNTKPEQNHDEEPHAKQVNLPASRLWTESFFFKPDDYRLQEGLDFIKKMELEELSDFTKLRRDLKQIVKHKVKNNQRKNKPFKKKLGGSKKRIKIKKAMKR